MTTQILTLPPLPSTEPPPLRAPSVELRQAMTARLQPTQSGPVRCRHCGRRLMDLLNDVAKGQATLFVKCPGKECRRLTEVVVRSVD